jgi:exonuclease SbcD
MAAHPRIVHLIPQLKNKSAETETRVEASDLQEDIQTLFKKYYVSQKGLDPNEELMTLFREVLDEGGKS